MGFYKVLKIAIRVDVPKGWRMVYVYKAGYRKYFKIDCTVYNVG
jgi:hypothetical protein